MREYFRYEKICFFWATTKTWECLKEHWIIEIAVPLLTGIVHFMINPVQDIDALYLSILSGVVAGIICVLLIFAKNVFSSSFNIWKQQNKAVFIDAIRELPSSKDVFLIIKNNLDQTIHNIWIDVLFYRDDGKLSRIKRDSFSMSPSEEVSIKAAEYTNNQIFLDIDAGGMIIGQELLGIRKTHEIEFILRENNSVLDNRVVCLRLDEEKIKII